MNKRVRVLLVTSGFLVEAQSGGVGRFTIELSESLDREQFEPILLGLWHYGTQFEERRMARLRSEGIEALVAARWDRRLAALNVFRAFQGIREFLQSRTIEIIHSHTEFGDFPSAIAGRLHSVPVLIRTLHNHEWRRRPVLRPFARVIYPLIYDVEIGISQHVVGSLNRRLLARALARKAVYINAAISLQRHKAASPDVRLLRQSLGIPEQALVVGSVGRLSVQKGYPNFLIAASLAAAKLSNVFFVLIGTGEMEEELKALARKLHIEDKVVFTGSRNDVEELLKCMDLFVSSSLWEGMPGVVLDSMAAGVPVVATDIPGTRELVRDGVTGWLVQPAAPEQLSAAIITLLQKPEEAKALAQRASEFVADFSIEESAAKHAEVYHRALVAKRRSSALDT